MLADANRTITAGQAPAPRPRTPSWWADEQTITRDNLEAAKAMGFVVGQIN